MKHIFLIASMITLSACESDADSVFVPLGEPEVRLVVRASSLEVSVGEPVVLYTERLNRGKWRPVRRKELTSGQCYLRQAPPQHEKEVADNLHWQVFPPEGVRFNTNFRPDHTREVIFARPGTYTLESSSTTWCHPGILVKGDPLKIVVYDDKSGALINR